MGPGKFLLASITTVSILLHMFLLLHMFPHASSELIAFPPEAADGPAADSPDAAGLVLTPGPPPRVFDVDGYGASAGGDDTEV